MSYKEHEPSEHEKKLIERFLDCHDAGGQLWVKHKEQSAHGVLFFVRQIESGYAHIYSWDSGGGCSVEHLIDAELPTDTKDLDSAMAIYFEKNQKMLDGN